MCRFMQLTVGGLLRRVRCDVVMDGFVGHSKPDGPAPQSYRSSDKSGCLARDGSCAYGVGVIPALSWGASLVRSARMTAAVLVPLMMAGCASQPSATAPNLEPAAKAQVWPQLPDTPRYAYVRTLVGERDFVPKDSKGVGTFTKVLKWIAGIFVGDPDYLELRRPVSGMTDEAGRVFVVDASHRAIIVFDMLAKKVRKWPLAAEGQQFVSPVAVAGDGAGGLLVTDAELKEVFQLDRSGRPVRRFGKGVFGRPTGIARDNLSGRIYVSDTVRHDIKIFDARGNLIGSLGARGKRQGTFNAPTYLSFHNNELYVSDTLNFRVQIFDRAGDGQLMFGKLGLFVGRLTRPKGVAVGQDGRIYVVESYFDHLLIFNRDGQLLLPIGGTGNGIGEFYLPAGVWVDRKGRVMIADMFNGRIVVLKELPGENGS